MRIDPESIPKGPKVALKTDRKCADCQMCCRYLRIEEEGFISPAGQWCEHATDKGCSIFETRFKMCQDYKCGWLMGYFKDEHRPDLVKLIATHCAATDPDNDRTFEYWHVIEVYLGGHKLSRAGMVMREVDRDTLPIMVTCTSAGKSTLYQSQGMLRAKDSELRVRWHLWHDLMKKTYEV